MKVTKNEFLDSLDKKLFRLSQVEREEQLAFYSEMIEDRMEEGATESEAVESIGSVELIAHRILGTAQAEHIAEKPGQEKRKLRTWEIVLLVAGSPVWVSLLIAAVAVVFSLVAAGVAVLVSLVAVIFSLVVVAWSLVISFAATCLAGIVLAIFHWVKGNGYAGLAYLGTALFSVGVFIFSLVGSIAATKGTLRLTGKLCKWIAGLVRRKEARA